MRINAIDVRQLRYFVCVAEELHFGRAARRLHMSQPPLSQQIKALENHLGVLLFRRTQRSVALTPAGHYLLPEARRLLHDMGRIAEQTKQAEAGLTGHLRVGVNFSAPLHPFTPRLLQKFHKLYPYVGVELVLHEQANILQLADLKGAHLDLALIWLEAGHADKDITRIDLATDPLDAVVPASHPLAKKDRIHIRDLDGQPFIAQPRHAGTQRFAGIMEAFASIRSEPRIVYEALQMPLVMSMVAAGQGVSLLPSFLSRIGMPGVAFRPLAMPRSRPPAMTYNLVGSASNANPAAINFFNVAREMV